MTTRFKSFDASPLGAFVHSRLGARNVAVPDPASGLTVLIVWIDEAGGNYIQAPSRYDVHKRLWESELSARDGDLVLALVWGDSSIDALLPVGAEIPTGIIASLAGRSLSGEGILNKLASDVPEGRGVNRIRILIDTSGSFQGLPRLGDALSRFFILAAERWRIGITENILSFSHQDWVAELTSSLVALVPRET